MQVNLESKKCKLILFIELTVLICKLQQDC